MIAWKNTLDERPPNGAKIVALSWHWKNRFPGSMEIIGGTVCRWGDRFGPSTWSVETDDDSGKGAFRFDSEEVDAWCFADEFLPAFPDFLTIKKEGE